MGYNNFLSYLLECITHEKAVPGPAFDLPVTVTFEFVRKEYLYICADITFKMTGEVQKIFEAEAKAVMNIPVTANFNIACDLIYEAVHINRGKVVASGMGKAGQIALNIATTLSATGTPAVFLHPADAQHGDLGVIQPDDILLLISNSGKTLEILELCELSKNLGYKMKTIVITGNPDSPLGNLSDVTISTGHPDEVCPLGLTPTTSTTVMTVIGDALVVLMMKKIGFTAADYAKRHHGGYLGVKSRHAAGQK